ncbi:MAG: HAD hydrolase family protein [Candidatus Marinimicrobia bacterium]|nr:HAD hydrolase family protein [Candidatus Neomarinimicrobiota bacterium]
MNSISPALKKRLKDIRLIITDVDGVLTDGSFYIGKDTEIKRFHSKDGLAIVLLQLLEIPIAIISGRYSEATLARTRALRIPDDLVFQNNHIKISSYKILKTRLQIKDHEIAYIGDDFIDEPVLRQCGVSFAPANAISEIKAIVDYVTDAPGGSGALREMVDMILHAQNRMNEALKKLQGMY